MASPTAAVAFQFLVREYIADPNFDFASGYIRLSNPDVLHEHTRQFVIPPEPSTWLMLGAGILVLRLFRR